MLRSLYSTTTSTASAFIRILVEPEYEKSQKAPDQNIVYYLHIILISFIALHILYFILILLIQKRTSESVDAKTGLRKINEDCSFCMENISNEIQLFCSHSFCGKCMLAYVTHRFNGAKVICPMCRQTSKLIIVKFQEDETNKELYEQFAIYNNEVTAYYQTSLCLILDISKFTKFFIKQLFNTNNPDYGFHRCIISTIILICIIIALIPLFNQGEWGEFIMDITIYLVVIIIMSKIFYQSIRNITNYVIQRRNSQQV